MPPAWAGPGSRSPLQNGSRGGRCINRPGLHEKEEIRATPFSQAKTQGSAAHVMRLFQLEGQLEKQLPTIKVHCLGPWPPASAPLFCMSPWSPTSVQCGGCWRGGGGLRQEAGSRQTVWVPKRAGREPAPCSDIARPNTPAGRIRSSRCPMCQAPREPPSQAWPHFMPSSQWPVNAEDLVCVSYSPALGRTSLTDHSTRSAESRVSGFAVAQGASALTPAAAPEAGSAEPTPRGLFFYYWGS